MATTADQFVYPVMMSDGGEPPLLWLPEAAAQAFQPGEFVFLDGNGRVTIIASDTPALIYGVAAIPASGTTDADVGVYRISSMALFEINIKQAALANHVLAQADLGASLGIQRDTVNKKVFLNSAVTGGGARMFVHRISPRLPNQVVGDTNVRVLATFLPSIIQA